MPLRQYVTVVTPASGVDSFLTGSNAGKLLVSFWRSIGGNGQSDFALVIFKP
jgi:hypothetical protein